MTKTSKSPISNSDGPSGPLQQGQLDCFCSVYATINLLRRRGMAETWDDLTARFRQLVEYIDAGGNLEAYLTKGADVRHVSWLLKKAGFTDLTRTTSCDIDWICRQQMDDRDVMIYVADHPRSRTGFTHYTLIDRIDDNGAIQLVDSYGFDRMEREGDRWDLGGNSVHVVHAWSIGPQASG